MDGHCDFESDIALTRNLSPAMRLAHASLGGVKKWRGNVSGLGGLLQRTFEIDSNGKLDNGNLQFFETLTFNDGAVETRQWRLFETPAGLDVEGDGISLILPGVIVDGALVIAYRVKFGALTFDYKDVFNVNSDGSVRNDGEASLLGVTLMHITAHAEA